MTANELPARYARLTATEAAHMLEMTREALAENDSPAMREHAANLEKVVALRGGRETALLRADLEDDVTVGRQAGSAASNQFGTFTVHAASAAQVRFLSSLIAEKDTTGVPIPSSLDGISKKSASALIEKLIDRPRKAGAAPAPGAKLASEKQINLIAKLNGEKLLDTATQCAVDAVLENPAQCTSSAASKLIDALFAAPRKPVAAAAPAVEHKPGAYKVNGRIIRVYLGQQSRKMLAAELVDAAAEDRDDAWKYLGLAARFVPADAVRMTVEECEAVAGAGQATHGWCCVCGRKLDDPNSVARGIGPVCRSKQGGM